MQSEQFLIGKDVPVEDLGDGISRQILGHNDELMLVKVMFEAGSIGYQHKHVHSQVSYIVSGVFDVTIDGVTKRQSAGDSSYMPPNVMHGSVCVEAGTILDMFSPIREDFFENYKKGETS